MIYQMKYSLTVLKELAQGVLGFWGFGVLVVVVLVVFVGSRRSLAGLKSSGRSVGRISTWWPGGAAQNFRGHEL